MFARSTLAVLVSATALGVAACGGSKDGADSGGPFTRAQLATKADAICAKARLDAAKVPSPTDARDTDASATYFSKIAPISQQEADSFAALTPDAAAKTDWEALVAGQRTIAGAFDAMVAKAKAGKSLGASDYGNALKAAEPFIDASTKIGAKTCAGAGATG
ncbi:MAG: hypothetical protein AAGC46_01350 [Solirubrobacteraceae bacterium]|nr:hypothetical protein [Patulibacter sp.]